MRLSSDSRSYARRDRDSARVRASVSRRGFCLYLPFQRRLRSGRDSLYREVIEIRNRELKMALGVFGHHFRHGQGRIGNHDATVTAKSMPNPPQPDGGNIQNPRCVCQSRPRPVYEFRFDAIHEPPADALHSAPQQSDDCRGNQEADERVGKREAEHDTERARHHGE